MIPISIKTGVERDEEIREFLHKNGYGESWTAFTRVVFNGIARRINRRVTQRVMQTPTLVSDHLLVGEDELRSLFFREKLDGIEDLIAYLKTLSPHNPHRWISGKSLQSYWNGGRAKDKKLNVLLTFLGAPVADWENWKLSARPVMPASTQTESTPFKTYPDGLDLIKKYHLGDYFLYYQKTDGSPTIIKAPFSIRTDARGLPIAETITEGQRYRSSKMELRDGVLYIECENLEFNEKENHVFYVGNDTNPEVILGVSSTISVKRKLPIGIRNVLVRQDEPFDKHPFEEKEIPFDAGDRLNEEERIVMAYLKRQPLNLLIADFGGRLEELGA